MSATGTKLRIESRNLSELAANWYYSFFAGISWEENDDERELDVVLIR